MKKIIITIVFVLVASTVFAQYKMIVKKTDNTYTNVLVSDISEIKFVDCPGTITYAGQTYNTVLIGSQCWLRENLDVGVYVASTYTGSSHSDVSNNGTIEKYCYENNEANCTIYGGLYEWAEAVQYQNGATNTISPNPVFSGNVQGICPTGWHIPTLAEQQALATAVSNNGNALKALGQGTDPGAGTNTSGFSALLAGDRHDGGSFGNLGGNTGFWSSTEVNATNAYVLYLWGGDSYVVVDNNYKGLGYSIRCLKD